VIGILTVAKALANFHVNNAVRFGFWSAEEFGVLGSNHYIRSINGSISGSAADVAKVRAYLNFDMVRCIYSLNPNAPTLTNPLQ
jgi:Zn-dependent M28 family amino/carboxypeptidase